MYPLGNHISNLNDLGGNRDDVQIYKEFKNEKAWLPLTDRIDPSLNQMVRVSKVYLQDF